LVSRVFIQVRLLSGRYHAHPWGEAQHAMAGPEWPPSPWRLLRGLAAAWFDADPPPVTEAERDDLLQTLGRASAPTMWLPPVSFAEIPYYQPIVEGSQHKRVLHFDHFAVLSESENGPEFCFDFDVGLSAQQRTVLHSLLARMTYFGRAESRAHLSLVDAPAASLRNVTPEKVGVPSGEQVRRRVLVTRDGFHTADLWAAGPGGGHLVQAMVEEGRRLPPNTRWIDYALPSMLVRPALPRRPTAPSRARPCVTAVHFGLFRRIPIRLPELVRVAREIRDQAVMSFETRVGSTSWRLSGREDDGSVAKGHRHAFWMPEPDGGRGCLRGCRVWLPDGASGIDQRELNALLSVRHIFRDDDCPILVVAEDVLAACPEPRPSRRWRSLTPFLAPLHDRPGRSELEPAEQLRRMAEEVAGASPRVTAISGPGALGKVTPVRTHLYQSGTWRWTRRAAAWFELEFDTAVDIPRPLGADAHFGLGRFVPLGH
jgi:CRISPR-associated protein Csb2